MTAAEFAVMTANKLNQYTDLMRSFVENKITVYEFERRYLAMFKADKNTWTEAEYETLNNLFSDVDAFCANPELRDDNDIDEDQLREATELTLAKLSSSM